MSRDTFAQGMEEFTLKAGNASAPNVIDPAIARSNNARTFVDYLFERLVRSGIE